MMKPTGIIASTMSAAPNTIRVRAASAGGADAEAGRGADDEAGGGADAEAGRGARSRTPVARVAPRARGSDHAASTATIASSAGCRTRAWVIPAPVSGGTSVRTNPIGTCQAPTSWRGDHTAKAVPRGQVARTAI